MNGFLRQVLNQTSKHLILIHDGARYHTSKATRAFFEAYKDRLTVFQLPSYSPDYNPIEFLWKNMKQHATHNQYFPESEDLASPIEGALAYSAGLAKSSISSGALYRISHGSSRGRVMSKTLPEHLIDDFSQERQRIRNHRNRLHTRSAKRSQAQLKQLEQHWKALPPIDRS